MDPRDPEEQRTDPVELDLTEVVLTGGNVNAVVRVGETVRREAGAWTPAVQRLLRHLESVGFPYAPRVLGMDEQGREILAYVDGTAAQRPWPPVLLRDEGLHQMGRMLADLRDALVTFRWTDEDLWRFGGVGADGPQEIRHGDIAPWNMLWDDDQLVALLDWDFAEPAPPLWDFAQLAWYAVPLRVPPRSWEDSGFTSEPDLVARLEIVAGYAGVSAAALVAVLHDVQACDLRRVRELGAAGVHPFASFLERGFVPEIEAESAWLHDFEEHLTATSPPGGHLDPFPRHSDPRASR